VIGRRRLDSDTQGDGLLSQGSPPLNRRFPVSYGNHRALDASGLVGELRELVDNVIAPCAGSKSVADVRLEARRLGAPKQCQNLVCPLLRRRKLRAAIGGRFGSVGERTKACDG
jgi:hypothetical protein